MLDGIQKTRMKTLPRGATLAGLEALARGVAADLGSKTTAKGGTKTASHTRAQLRAQVRDLHKRLTSGIRGYWGRESPEVAKYGLTPRKPAVRRKHRKKAVATPALAHG